MIWGVILNDFWDVYQFMKWFWPTKALSYSGFINILDKKAINVFHAAKKKSWKKLNFFKVSSQSLEHNRSLTVKAEAEAIITNKNKNMNGMRIHSLPSSERWNEPRLRLEGPGLIFPSQ